nr:unnamed protein product [Digitaria exilis]
MDTNDHRCNFVGSCGSSPNHASSHRGDEASCPGLLPKGCWRHSPPGNGAYGDDDAKGVQKPWRQKTLPQPVARHIMACHGLAENQAPHDVQRNHDLCARRDEERSRAHVASMLEDMVCSEPTQEVSSSKPWRRWMVQCSGTLKALSWQQRHIATTT